MGNNCCNAIHDPRSYEVQSEGKDEPSTSYAVQVIDPKDIPCDINSIRARFKDKEITKPQWYHEGDGQAVDILFFIKRYDLYYKGQWRSTVPHGLGEVVTAKGQYFKGYFKQGVANGPKCLLVISETSFYFGAVEKNQRNGAGIFCDGDYSYEGQWVQNRPHGTGRQKFQNGDVFYGQFVHGSKQKWGQYTWKTGIFQSYKGQFKENQICGEGELRCREGQAWKGQFNCDRDFQIDAQCSFGDQTFKGKMINGFPSQVFSLTIKRDKQEKNEDLRYEVRLSNNKMSGQCSFPKKFKIFQDKMLDFYDETLPPEKIRHIIDVIESCYADSTKHSAALERIQGELKQYRCSFWKQKERVEGMAIVPICGRHIKVQQK